MIDLGRLAVLQAPPMPISSYVVLCRPEDQSLVRAALLSLPGVEIGEPTGTGIPVVVDSPTARAAEEMGERLQQLTGVKAATLVYHNFEDVEENPTSPNKVHRHDPRHPT